MSKFGRVYKLGCSFLFYPDERRLLCCSDESPESPPKSVNLPDRAMDVLLVLFEMKDGPGVESNELLRRVWGAKGGDRGNLTHAIKNLRDRLRDWDKDHEYIERIQGGYRFVASVNEIARGISLQPESEVIDQGSGLSEASTLGISKESQTATKPEPHETPHDIRGLDDNTAKWWKRRTARVAGLVIVVIIIIGLLIAPKIGQKENEVDNFVVEEQALTLYRDGWPLYEEADKLNEQGHVELAQEKYNQAEALLRKATQLSPSRALYHSALGWALFDQRKFEAARQAFSHVLELKSTSEEKTWAHHGLGLVYEEVRDLEKAEEHLKKAVGLATGDELADCKEDLERVRKNRS